VSQSYLRQILTTGREAGAKKGVSWSVVVTLCLAQCDRRLQVSASSGWRSDV